MKSIWTVIITIIVTAGLVGGGGYYYLNDQHESEKADMQSQIDDLRSSCDIKKASDATTTDDSATSSTTTSDTSDDWKTYTNTTYDFTITFTDLWSGYDVVGEALSGNTYNYRVYVPTANKSFSLEKPGYAAPITIGIFTLDQWEVVSKEVLTPTKVDENDTYVLTYSNWQDSPQDLLDSGLSDEITAVSKTIKFTD